MSKIHICKVVVCNNPAPFLEPLEFEITFDCIETLQDDLEWKIIYVGSAETEDFDQTLDTVFVGPAREGRHRFLFRANPPDISKLPQKAEDVIGLTLLMLTCSYRKKEFIRIGYYVNIQYTDKELADKPPEQPDFSKMNRNIMADKSRVTKFTILWDDESPFKSVRRILPAQINKKVIDEVIDLDEIPSNNNTLHLKEPLNPDKLQNKETHKEGEKEEVSREEEVVDEEEKKQFLSDLHSEQLNKVTEVKESDENIMTIDDDDPMIIKDDSEDSRNINTTSSVVTLNPLPSKEQEKIPSGA